ncbi:MAG: hypothetical protein JXR76_08780, partial [Deltaproteobacteria bacterium]|nr:hypothetical protein [Deltaproteobacteria bacterium]
RLISPTNPAAPLSTQSAKINNAVLLPLTITYCNIPIDIAVGEAFRLKRVLVDDAQALLDAGIEPGIVASLGVRVGALDVAAAEYRMAIERDPDAVKAWKEAAQKGYALRKYMIKHMSFAFRNEAALLTQLKHIQEGRGHLDMVADLMSLKKLAERNVAYLAKTPLFDRNTIAEAETLHNALNELYADATLDPDTVNAAKDMFHRAWSYYKMAADEIKEYGKYVFEGTDRYQEYISDYMSSRGSKSVDSTADDSETTQSIPA